ncbi:uncharacterized protein [Apostichopus japonicus]|uniref:uncharacterized protein isoform X2 n=1 Tax=Stichopus japonicus TaxID=307972 RepID=UPI003AB78AF8
MAEEDLGDGLAAINVDQLSRDVNALVQAAADINPPFESDNPEDSTCQTLNSGKDDGMSQLYFGTSYVQSSSTEDGQTVSESHRSSKHFNNSDKLMQQLNKGTVYIIPSQYPSNSASNSYLQQGSNQTPHFQPILPATLAPSAHHSGTNATPPELPEESATTLGASTPELTSDVAYGSSERNGQYCGPSVSHSASGIVGTDIDVSSFPSNVGLNITEVEEQGPDQNSIRGQVQCDDQRHRMASSNPHTQLDIQVPSNSQSQLLNTLTSQSTQNLLSQLALFSPGNQEGGNLVHQQSSHLQSLLSPHSQSVLLPYLLRTMASPGGQLNSNALDLNLLTDSTPSCSQTQEVNSDLNLPPHTSQEIGGFHDHQEMQHPDLTESRNNSRALQSYKSLKHPQVLGLDLPVQGTSAMETDPELSTIAPSIITSSIHSLCLPASGVNSNALNSGSLSSGLNCHMNVLASSLVQNGLQLSNMIPSVARSAGNAPNDVDLQSLAMHLSEIRNNEARISEYQVETQDATNQEYYCVQCDESMPQACPQHGPPRIITDNPIQKRAQITLPSCLYLKKSKVSKKFFGVWAKEILKVGCRFGPLEGTCLKKLPPEVDSLSPLLWKIFQNSKVKHYLCVKDEDVSNWMMYVKRARKLEEQNLAAHQINGNIYFTSKRDIQVGEELLLWYNKDYAKMCGATRIPEDSFKCNLCGRQFSYRQELDGHIQYRHPSPSERNFICKICSKAFKTSTKLKVHSFKHSGDKPFPCKVCQKSFTDNSNLRRHARIHSGEKKFECGVCGMLFRQKAHLVTHTVTHTGEKKLKCQYCGKTYGRKADLWQHLMFHSQEKKHTCSVCSRSFLRSQHLKNHMVTHTKERNYSCSYCKKTYQTTTHLQRHENSCSKRYNTLARVTQG